MKRFFKIASWVAAVAGVIVYWSRKRPVERSEIEPPNRNVETWDVVDEASWESFPASDPPAYH